MMLSATLTLLAATVYAYIAARLHERPVTTTSRNAWSFFIVWWEALAAATLLGALRSLLYMQDLLTPWLFDTLSEISLALLLVGIMGLVYYMVYLYTGWSVLLPWLAAFYVTLYVTGLALLRYLGEPVSFSTDGWVIVAERSRELPSAVVYTYLFLFLVPPIVAAFAYMGLYPRATTPTQRYRVRLVSITIIAWFGSAVLANVLDLTGTTGWQLASRLIGLTSAFLILAAYLPPRWLRRRLSIQGIAPPGIH